MPTSNERKMLSSNEALKELNIKIYNCLVLNETNINNFHPVEVAGRGSDTQLRLVKN